MAVRLPFVVTMAVIIGLCGAQIPCKYNYTSAYWDLTPLVRTTGQSDWGMSSQGWNFKWNYCSNTVGAGCMLITPAYFTVGSLTTSCTSIGMLNTLKFSPIDENNPRIGIRMSYSTNDLCDNGNNFLGIDIDNYCDENVEYSYVLLHPSTYSNCRAVIEVKTRHACPQYGDGGSSSGLSLGSWLLIILLIGVTLYLSIGMGLNYKLKGERGIDMIPHLSFWKEFPLLVKDGMIWTYVQLQARIGRTQPAGGGQWERL